MIRTIFYGLAHGVEILRVNPKEQKSFNDLEAMPMAKIGHEFKYGYNAQAAVDETFQIIVAAELHDNPQDSHALPSMLEKIEETCGKNTPDILADSGYQSVANLEAVQAKGSIPYIAVARGEELVAPTVAEQVTATETPHAYLCPSGKLSPYSATSRATKECEFLSKAAKKSAPGGKWQPPPTTSRRSSAQWPHEPANRVWAGTGRGTGISRYAAWHVRPDCRALKAPRPPRRPQQLRQGLTSLLST